MHTQLGNIVQVPSPNTYCLGQWLACGGEKPAEVIEKWDQLTKSLVREVSITQVSGTLFKAAIHAVLLLESEMWMMTHCMG